MENFDIKSVENFAENETNKTRLKVCGKDFEEKEIILEGKGSIKIAVQA